ncbi:hypothetical protein SK128_013693, partial [Halocaridina rubra]
EATILAGVVNDSTKQELGRLTEKRSNNTQLLNSMTSRRNFYSVKFAITIVL